MLTEIIPAALTLKQIALYTSICPASIYLRMEDRIRPFPRGFRSGRRRLWLREDVDKWMREKTKERQV